MRFDLALAWTGLVIPNIDHFASPAGTGKLTGTIADYAYDFSGTIDVDGRPANASGNGRGARGELTFERVVLGPLIDGAAAGTLSAAGTVSFARSVADLTLDLQNVNPRWIHPSVPGRLSGTGTLHTEFAPEVLARFGAVALTGELRQYPVIVKGAADVDGNNRWHLDKLALDSGPNRISLDGTLSPEDLDVAVAARVDNLDLVWPGLRGGLDGEASFAGSWAEPHGRGHAEAHDLALGELSIERLMVTGEAGLPKERGSISRSTRAGSRAARSRSTRSSCRSRARLPRTERDSRRTRRTGSRPLPRAAASRISPGAARSTRSTSTRRSSATGVSRSPRAWRLAASA